MDVQERMHWQPVEVNLSDHYKTNFISKRLHQGR